MTSPDKYAVFSKFYDTGTFLASSVSSPSPDIFILDSLASVFDTCGKKGEYDEEEGIVYCAGTGVFNFTSS